MATGMAGRDAGRMAPPPGSGAAAGSAWPAFLGGLALVGCFGFAAWGLSAQLAKGLDKVWPLPPPPAAAPAADLPPDLVYRPEDTKPKPRQWTVAEMSTAVTTLPGEIENLVAEAHQDLRQLEDPGELADAAKQARARMFFTNWGRAFGNQIKVLEKRMPPEDQCRPYSSIEKGCRIIHIAFKDLQRAPAMTTVKAARTTLDAAVKEMKATLAPPAAPVPAN